MSTANGMQQVATQPGGPLAKISTPASGFALESIDQAWRWAQCLAQADHLLPRAFQGKPGNVLVAVLFAQDLGISPMTVIREAYFVNDRIGFMTEFKIALVMRTPDCEAFECIHTSTTKATWRTKRRGHKEPKELSVTADEMQHLINAAKGPTAPWNAYRANMLRWRCASFLIDMVYPDKVLGVKTKEELEDVVDVQPLGDNRFGRGVGAVVDQIWAPPPASSPPQPAPAEEAKADGGGEGTATESPPPLATNEASPVQGEIVDIVTEYMDQMTAATKARDHKALFRVAQVAEKDKKVRPDRRELLMAHYTKCAKELTP